METLSLYDAAIFCKLPPDTAARFVATYKHRRHGLTPTPYYTSLYLEHFVNGILSDADLTPLDKLMFEKNKQAETYTELKKLGILPDTLCQGLASCWHGIADNVDNIVYRFFRNNLCRFELKYVNCVSDPFENLESGVWHFVKRDSPTHSIVYQIARKLICDACIQVEPHRTYYNDLDDKQRTDIEHTCVVCKKYVVEASPYSIHDVMCDNSECKQRKKQGCRTLSCVVCQKEL